MKTFLSLLAVVLLASCNNNDDKATVITETGQWRLKEVLADPGDGTGTFQAVESNKFLSFNANGVIQSNGNLCDMSLNADTPTTGTYSAADSTISSDCTNGTAPLHYTLEGNTIIVTYPCFEPCRAKYVRVIE